MMGEFDSQKTEKKQPRGDDPVAGIFPESKIPEGEESSMLRDAQEAILTQSVLKDNIASYKAANTAYVDALHTLKAMGLLERFGERIAPFPQRQGIQIIQGNNPSPQPPQQSPQPVHTSAPPKPPYGDVKPPMEKTPIEIPQKKPMPKWLKGVMAAMLTGTGVAGGMALNEWLDKDNPPAVEAPAEIDPNVNTEVY